MVHDIVIVGAGPAGITAAIYAARKMMDFVVLSKDVGGQTLWSADIENYTGYQIITGIELVSRFTEHLDKLDVKISEPEEVTRVSKEGRLVKTESDKGEYLSKTVIIATGRQPKKLEVDSEDRYLGKGLTYCATCDGPLFSGRDVAVIGGGNAALEAVLQMMKIAAKVYLIDISPELKADAIMVLKARSAENVEIINSSRVVSIKGDKFVSGITLDTGSGKRELEVSGIFAEIGSLPLSDMVEGVKKIKNGEISVNCMTATDIPGIFAAGDVTSVYAKQIIVACGEGAKAAMASFEYIGKNK
jgi:alkyl hydroperoxide reductase subunit F